MKVGDLVRTIVGTGIILEYDAKWENDEWGCPWYVWVTGAKEIQYFKANELEVLSESG